MQAVIAQVSGGLDSLVSFWWALAGGFFVYPVTFLYGQRAEAQEQVAASSIISAAREAFPEQVGEHSLIRVSQVFKSNLTNNGPVSNISSHVPGRNASFLALSFSLAEGVGAVAVYVGVNATDCTNRADNTYDFYKVLEAGFNQGIAAEKRLTVEMPVVDVDKAGVLRRAIYLQAPYSLSWSCFEDVPVQCGICEACVTVANAHKEVFG